jgi:hypothetical protein
LQFQQNFTNLRHALSYVDSNFAASTQNYIIMNIAIVGSRNPGINYAKFEELLLARINLGEVTQIVSGGAKGIDTFAKLFAGKHHIPLMEFLPKYGEHGKYATLRRNTEIVREANLVVAFPTADSKGTLHSISEAKRMGRRLIVVKI